MFYFYILRSLKNGKLYLGYTPDLKARVKSHNNGFMFAHGSACGSLPSTSTEGWRYIADVYFFRKDQDNKVDVDRYIGSITPDETLAILKIPISQIPEHHLKSTDPLINNLPSDKQKQVLSILGT